jgi:protein phosphatase
MKNSYHSDLSGDKLKSVLENAVKLANFTVYDQAQQFEDFSGMGTTLSAALVRGREVTAVNVGDSRVYKINDEGITQMVSGAGSKVASWQYKYPGP